MHAIDDLKSSIKEFHQDGIELTYKYAKDNFNDKAINTIVMVRNPNAKSNGNSETTLSIQPKKKKNNAVLITAISLLPELIAIIKN